MGEVIKLPRRSISRDVEKALRVLLHKVRVGEISGLAFVALKCSGKCCSGVVSIPDESESIDAARRLIDAIRGQTPFIEPLERP